MVIVRYHTLDGGGMDIMGQNGMEVTTTNSIDERWQHIEGNIVTFY